MTTHPTTSRYVTFYKVMLILSTIGTSLGVLGLISLPAAIAEFHYSPIYAIAASLDAAVLFASIAALVLLWQKKLIGYQLKISTYVASIMVAIFGLFGIPSYSRYAAEQAIADSKDMTADMISFIYGFTEVAMYVATALAIAIAVTFLLLWRAAWKRQMAADKKHHA